MGLNTATISAGPASPAAAPGGGLLRVLNNAQLTDLEKKAIEGEKQAQEPIKVTLASHVQTVFDANKKFREDSGIDSEMLANLRQRNSSYSDDKLSAIEDQGISKVFLSLTDVKCSAAEAWIHDVLSSPTDKAWKLSPTPIPDLPEDVEEAVVMATMRKWWEDVQSGVVPEPQEAFELAKTMRDHAQKAIFEEALERAGRMETKIEDQLYEGHWQDIFEDFVTDLVTLKAAIIKGPVTRKHVKLAWKKNRKGKTAPRTITEEHYEFDRVSPFDMYPSEGSVDINDGDLCERVRYTRQDISDVMGAEGWDDMALSLVLKDFGVEGYRLDIDTDFEREELEKRSTNPANIKGNVEGIEYWGSAQGQLLIDEGMDKMPDGKPVEPLRQYQMNIITLAGHVVFKDFNPDPLLRRPYSKTGYRKIPGSWWYKGVPELMKDLQDICNASVRAMCNNLAIASGPQGVIDITRLAPGEDVTNITPWRLWQVMSKPGDTSSPISFHNIPSNAGELMGVYDKFSSMADDFTGIPAYAYGNDRVAGAGRTASGLEMLMNSSARGIKRVIARVDQYVMSPILTRLYELNMMYDEDEFIKGDAQVKPVGMIALILKEQMADRRQQFLQATANPIDLQIVDLPRRANVIRAQAKTLEMPVEDVVPPADEMRARQRKMEMAQQAQAQAEAQAAAAPAQ